MESYLIYEKDFILLETRIIIINLGLKVKRKLKITLFLPPSGISKRLSQ